MEVVVVLPFAELLVEQPYVVVYAAFVEELVELLVVRAVRALDLAVEPGCAWPDVDVLDVEVSQVPMKLRLKLRAVVRLNNENSKWKPADNLVDELNRSALIAAVVNLQHPDTSAVVDSSELVKALGRAMNALQKLYVHLEPVPGLLLFVALPLMFLALVLSVTARQSAQAMTL